MLLGFNKDLDDDEEDNIKKLLEILLVYGVNVNSKDINGNTALHLVLRGDPLKGQKYFQAEEDGHANASELVEQIINMNKGKYLDEHLENKTTTDFSIGVAGYHEKHLEAPNLTIEEYI